MRKNLMRVLALTMLFVMLAAGAYAETVKVSNTIELQNAIAAANDGDTIVLAVDGVFGKQGTIEGGEFTQDPDNVGKETAKVTKKVNVTITIEEDGNYIPYINWLPLISMDEGSEGSTITFDGIKIEYPEYAENSAFAEMNSDGSTMVFKNSQIELTSAYGATPISLVKFSCNGSQVIIDPINTIWVTQFGNYQNGTIGNTVRIPHYDERDSENTYIIRASDSSFNYHLTANSNGTAYNHNGQLKFVKGTANCSSGGILSHYECDGCISNEYVYEDAEGRIWSALANLETDSYDPNNHEEIVSVPASTDACGNGIAAHYICTSEYCEKLFTDPDGKNQTSYEKLMTIGTNHSPTIKYSVGPATCTMAEIYKEFYQCDRMECGILLALVNGAQVPIMDNDEEYYDVDWNLAPHEMTKVPYKAPTATEDGNYEYYDCSSCEGWYYWDEEDQDYCEYYDKNDVIIPAGTSDHEHEGKWVEATSATATAHGYEGHWECETCGKWFDGWDMTNEITDKNTLLEHKNGYRFAEEKASCEERVPRVDHIVCEVSGCGRFFTDYTYAVELTEDEALWPIGAHTPNKEDYVAPTETEEGSKEYYWCGECFRMFWDEACTDEFIYEDEIIIPVVSHTHDNPATPVPEVPATETSTGVAAHYKCEGCGKLFKDAACATETTLEELTLQMLEHTHKPVHHERVEAAVGQDGTIEYYSCEGCDKLFADKACTQEITETDIVLHVHGNGTHVPQKDATYTEEGNIEHYACSCGKLFGEETCEKELTSVSIPKAVEIKGESAEVDAEAIINHAESASASGSGAITVPLSESTPVESVETTANALMTVANKELAIEFEMGKVADSQGAEKTVSVALDNAALTAALDGAQETDQVVLTVEQNDESALDSKQMNAAKEAGKVALVISASLKIGDTDIHSFEGGYAELRIPFEIQPGKNAADYVLYYLAEDGTAEKLEDAKFENGYIIVKVGHFSDFAVIDTNPAVSAADAVAEELPQTGDNSQLFLWMSLLMISLCAFAVSRKVRA